MLEVVLADQPSALRHSAHILVAWYHLSRLARFTPDDVTALRSATRALRDNWDATFHATEIKSLSKIPKIHRLDHVADSVHSFGPYNSLTTESSEAAHKKLKHMYRTCVLACASLLYVASTCASELTLTCEYLCQHASVRVCVAMMFVVCRSNKHAVADMFVTRLTRKSKVARLDAQLLHAADAAAEDASDDDADVVDGAADAPMPEPDADDDAADDAADADADFFRLGGAGRSADVQDLAFFLPDDALATAREVQHAGGLLKLVRDRVAQMHVHNPVVNMRTLLVHYFATRASGKRDGVRVRDRVHARRRFYGAMRYDWVDMEPAEGADGEVWYGRLLLLFSCFVGTARREFALLKWLDTCEPPREHVLGARHYVTWNQPPMVELVSTLRRRATFVTSPIPHGQRVVLLQLPYGADEQCDD